MSCIEKILKADIYCDILSCRSSDKDDSPIWTEFLRTKMLEYFIEKGNFSLEPAEGDMIYDLIRETYIDFIHYISSAVIPPVNISNLITDFRIDFPVCECQNVLKDTYSIKD